MELYKDFWEERSKLDSQVYIPHTVASSGYRLQEVWDIPQDIGKVIALNKAATLSILACSGEVDVDSSTGVILPGNINAMQTSEGDYWGEFDYMLF